MRSCLVHFCFLSTDEASIKYPKTHFRKILLEVIRAGRDPKPLIHTAKCGLLFFLRILLHTTDTGQLIYPVLCDMTHTQLLLLLLRLLTLLLHTNHITMRHSCFHEDKASPKILTTVSITTKQNSSPLNEHARN